LGETLVAELLGDSALRRSARRRATREFRPGRLPAAFVTALVLTVAGGLGAVLVVFARAGHPLAPGLVAGAARGLRHTHWGDARMLTACWLLVAAGALLILIAALPGRTRHEPLRGADPLFLAAISRAGLRQALLGTALAVPGIARGSVRLRGRLRRRVLVRVTTGYRNPGNLADMVRAAVFARLDQIEPVHGRHVVVRLKWRRD
jgi:hypothetical protein